MKNNILLILHKLTDQNPVGEGWRCPVCIYKNPRMMTAQEKDEMEWIQCSKSDCGVWVHMDCEDLFSRITHDWEKLKNDDSFNYECPMCKDPRFLTNLKNKCGMYKINVKRSETYDTVENLRKHMISKKRMTLQNQNYSYVDSDSYKGVEQLISQAGLDIEPLGLCEEDMLRDFADFNAFIGKKIFEGVDEDGNRIKVKKINRNSKNYK